MQSTLDQCRLLRLNSHLEMKRNDVCTVENLKTGDRFYKLNSKLKEAFQLIGQESHGKFEVIPPHSIRVGFPIPNQIKIFKGSTRVVYLRNINDKGL